MNNSNHKNLKLLLPTALITILLTACGGGGGGGGGSSDTGGGGFTTTSNTNTKPQASSESSGDASPQSSSARSESSALSSSGISSASSSSKRSGSVVDTSAPATPSDLTAPILNYDMAVISWSRHTDNVNVTSYKIYRNKFEIEQIDSIDTIFVDFNVAANGSYEYGVSAGDAAGNWSKVNAINVSTPSAPITQASSSSAPNNSTASSKSSASSANPDSTPPSTPANFRQLASNATNVDVAWSAATDNVAVSSYKVYRDNALIGSVDASTLEYSDKMVSENKQYIYFVEAIDAAGNRSPASKTILVSTPAATTTGDVTFYWSAPTQRENGVSLPSSELGGYLIRYRPKGETEYTIADIKNKAAATYKILNLYGDYEFQIAAYDNNNLYSSFIAIQPR